MKRAFVVMGVPASGTRLMARILIAAGCAGDGEHRQRWDERPPEGDLVVIRRHAPIGRPPKWAERHGNVIPALCEMGYETHGIIISREWYATIKGMVRWHDYTPEEAHEIARSCWRLIFEHMPDDMPYEIVSYESLVQRPAAVVDTLLSRIGLKLVKELEPIRDGNEKYFT